MSWQSSSKNATIHITDSTAQEHNWGLNSLPCINFVFFFLNEDFESQNPNQENKTNQIATFCSHKDYWKQDNNLKYIIFFFSMSLFNKSLSEWCVWLKLDPLPVICMLFQFNKVGIF